MNFKEIFSNIFNIIKEEKENVLTTSKYLFFINSPEGKIPHLHFSSTNKKEGCIELTKDKSANHKPNHTEFLTNKEKRELAFALCLPYRKNSNYTNYQYICFDWNLTNIKSNPYNKGAKLLDETEKKPLAYLKYLTPEDIAELKKIPNSAFDPKFEK